MEAQPDLSEAELEELEFFIFFVDDRSDSEDEEETLRQESTANPPG